MICASNLVTILVTIILQTLFLFNQPAFTLQFAPEFILCRQIQHVLGSKKLFTVVEYGVSDNGFVLFRAEDKSDGWIVTFREEFVIEHPDITIHLADVLMRQLADLEIDQEVAFQYAAVKNQIDVKIRVQRARL